MSHFKELK